MISSLATICIAATIGVTLWSGNQEKHEGQQSTKTEVAIAQMQENPSESGVLEVIDESDEEVTEAENLDDEQEEQVIKNDKVIYVANKDKSNNGGSNNGGNNNGGGNDNGNDNGGNNNPDREEVEDEMVIPTFTNVSVHDPAIIKAEDSYYVFGSHLGVAKTDD